MCQKMKKNKFICKNDNRLIKVCSICKKHRISKIHHFICDKCLEKIKDKKESKKYGWL